MTRGRFSVSPVLGKTILAGTAAGVSGAPHPPCPPRGEGLVHHLSHSWGCLLLGTSCCKLTLVLAAGMGVFSDLPLTPPHSRLTPATTRVHATSKGRCLL